MITRRRFLAFLPALPAVLSGTARAAPHMVRDIRHALTSDLFRLVLEFDGPLGRYTGQRISDPDRMVIDIPGATLPPDLVPDVSNEIVQGIRFGYQHDKRLRVVLDLTGAFPYRFRVWPTRDGTGERLVLDLDLTGFARTSSDAGKPVPKGPRKMVVVIDPGHGGKDPGAVGRRKTREKDVVLSISKKLLNVLKGHPNVVPYLTRGDDRFLRLRTRTRLARGKAAGLFVSVHADAARRRSASGASVYALSTSGASSEQAKWLAKKENAADLIGGIELEGVYEPEVHDALLDMSQSATIEYSVHAGKHMIKALAQTGKMHSKEVERAGFAVLKSPDMPSILVETGFISNSREEALLRSDKYQNKVAMALRRGILDFYRTNPEYS